MRKFPKSTIAIALAIGTTFTGISYAQAKDASNPESRSGESALANSLTSTKQNASDKDMVLLLLTGTGL